VLLKVNSPRGVTSAAPTPSSSAFFLSSDICPASRSSEPHQPGSALTQGCTQGFSTVRYARKVLGWPKRCELAHASLREYS
jgi:hypothetical protein